MMSTRRTLITALQALPVVACLLAVGTPAWSADLALGEVRKVDKAAAKITIKHGDIPSIEMPPMTMVFTVKEPAMLENAKAGDKIRFDVVQEGGKLIITHLEAAP